MSLRATVLAALAALVGCATSPSYGPLPRPEPEASLRRSSHPNGRLRSRVETLVLPDGREVPHGVEERWYSDGTLERRATWERGELVGLLATWWPDGTPRAELDYGDRRTPAPCRWHHREGSLHGEGDALAGVKLGRWTWYHPNGAVSHEGPYEAGKREGTWRFFREDGSPLAEGAYRAGRRVVPWTFWDEVGDASVRDHELPAEFEAALERERGEP